MSIIRNGFSFRRANICSSGRVVDPDPALGVRKEICTIDSPQGNSNISYFTSISRRRDSYEKSIRGLLFTRLDFLPFSLYIFSSLIYAKGVDCEVRLRFAVNVLLLLFSSYISPWILKFSLGLTGGEKFIAKLASLSIAWREAEQNDWLVSHESLGNFLISWKTHVNLFFCPKRR